MCYFPSFCPKYVYNNPAVVSDGEKDVALKKVQFWIKKNQKNISMGGSSSKQKEKKSAPPASAQQQKVFKPIADQFKSLDEVQDAMRKAGLEYFY